MTLHYFVAARFNEGPKDGHVLITVPRQLALLEPVLGHFTPDALQKDLNGLTLPSDGLIMDDGSTVHFETQTLDDSYWEQVRCEEDTGGCRWSLTLWFSNRVIGQHRNVSMSHDSKSHNARGDRVYSSYDAPSMVGLMQVWLKSTIAVEEAAAQLDAVLARS